MGSDSNQYRGQPSAPAVATASVPSYFEAQHANLSTDLAGLLRVLATITLKAAATGLGKSKIITVTNLLAVAITVRGEACGVVTVVENSTNPLTDFYIMRPTSGDDKETYSAGRSYAFTAPFGTQWATNQTLGYILTVSVGSADFIQDENA